MGTQQSTVEMRGDLLRVTLLILLLVVSVHPSPAVSLVSGELRRRWTYLRISVRQVQSKAIKFYTALRVTRREDIPV